MRKYNIFRLSCIVILWFILCYLVIRGKGINGPSLLAIIMSGAIVFIPLYKRWKKEGESMRNKK